MDDGDVNWHLCRFVLDDKDADRPTAFCHPRRNDKDAEMSSHHY